MQETKRIRTRDGAELSVRRLRAGDDAALQEFNRSLSPDSRFKFLPHQYDDATVAKALARSEAGDDLLLGAWDGGRLAGYFFLWYFHARVPLLGIGLLDAYQGRGLGIQMMEILIAEARGIGSEGIDLTTMQHNHSAFALYEKAGFKYYADVENVVGDGRIEIERAMFYEIKPGAKPMEGKHRAPV